MNLVLLFPVLANADDNAAGCSRQPWLGFHSVKWWFQSHNIRKEWRDGLKELKEGL